MHFIFTTSTKLEKSNLTVETVPLKKFMLAVYELNRIDFSDEERRMPCATAIALSDSNISASIVILY
jgi:hypothetical protein